MWLKIKEGETTRATIDFSTIKSIAKHWTGSRSELCLGQGCPHCTAGVPKRWRYQAQLYVERAPYSWEFGEQVMIELHDIQHENSLVHIGITRLGTGRTTRYEITQSENDTPQETTQVAITNKYTGGKYGHFVRN